MYRILVDYLLSPYLILIVLTALGLLSLWRRRGPTRRGTLLATVPFLLLILSSTPAVVHFVLGSLEWRYPEGYERIEGVATIVVLGGYIQPPSETRPHARLGWDSLNRCLHAVELYRQSPSTQVVVTGGRVEPDQPGPAIAEVMAEFLVQHGVAEEDLLLDNRSRNTYENAVEARKLLAPRGIDRVILVTDAIHLRRAEACFHKQGFDVVPSGSSYTTSDPDWSVSMFLPSPTAAVDMQRALHEWLGIVYYRLQGRI